MKWTNDELDDSMDEKLGNFTNFQPKWSIKLMYVTRSLIGWDVQGYHFVEGHLSYQNVLQIKSLVICENEGNEQAADTSRTSDPIKSPVSTNNTTGGLFNSSLKLKPKPFQSVKKTFQSPFIKRNPDPTQVPRTAPKSTSIIAKIKYPKNENSASSSSIYTPSLVKLINNDADKTEKDLVRQETATSMKTIAEIQERDLQCIRGLKEVLLRLGLS